MVLVYPIYFDKKRSKEFRRVSKKEAIENPLAKNIADVVRDLGYKCKLEPLKTHPADWANPGRVELILPEKISKHYLFKQIAKVLQHRPTKPEDPLSLPIQNVPARLPERPPTYPKGVAGNTIVPLHSPALSGGGVSENMFQDMMQEMQGQPEMANGMNPLNALAGMGMPPAPKQNPSPSRPNTARIEQEYDLDLE
ncbi:signal recognition particle subunit Sec65 [Schizosaccharomyces cryophilus OY26]|uniref:Signal recognition particle subunit Sec65 n=1 Tax=Schizosaccharomyces cryophilus (strain OY26 / ATCC MYA-4695 / CBS 11777 / NBRC 106824 / NRRL Y48691) TaxID=653667 RepID=S9VTQ8_SCHCR|nr:signal recognition particle subunit Sec65 [Schizosaccharomyces cryophilus OY26]EPY51263.1 signal recognition particle subunit Sec65 [Schizosaccharomyces cryophilus OY26]